MPRDDVPEQISRELGRVLLGGIPSEPPPGRVAAIRAAAGLLEQPEPSELSEQRDEVGDRRESRRWPAMLSAAAVALIAIGGVIGFVVANAAGDGDGDDGDTAEADLRAAGTVEYDGAIDGVGGAGDLLVVKTGIGRVITLDTTDLAILPTGEYYELWFVNDGPEGPDVISAGTFHPDAEGRSAVTFAAAVDPTLFPEIWITAEPGDGDPAPGGPVVMAARIEP